MSADTHTKAAKPKTEFIVINETVFKSWARDAFTFASFGGLIGIGIVAESSAMQWAGMILAAVILVVRSSSIAPKRMTREQAITYLQNRGDA